MAKRWKRVWPWLMLVLPLTVCKGGPAGPKAVTPPGADVRVEAPAQPPGRGGHAAPAPTPTPAPAAPEAPRGEVLATGEASARHLRVQGNDLFWSISGSTVCGDEPGSCHTTGGGGVRRMARAGGAVEALGGAGFVAGLAVDAESRTWVGCQSVDHLAMCVVHRDPQVGDQGEQLPMGTGNPPAHLAAAPGAAVWFGDGGQIVRWDRGSTSATPLAPAARVQGLAVLGEAVYWTEGAVGAVDGRVQAVPLAGGSARTVAADRPFPTRIVATGGTLVWAEAGPCPGSKGFGAVLRCEAASCQPEPLVCGVGGVVALAADATAIWFVSEHRLQRLDPITKRVEDVAPCAACTDLALADGQLYRIDGDRVVRGTAAGGQ